jgi:hypothetical protein
MNKQDHTHMADDRRPIPHYPTYTIDQEGRVRNAVRAHGRVYDCLLPTQDGLVTLQGPGPGRATRVVHTATLMAQVWPELVSREDVPCDTLDGDAAQGEEDPA